MSEADLKILVLNNSRETFTPSASGAICTCIREISLVAARTGRNLSIVSRDHPTVAPWDQPGLIRVEPISPDRRATALARRLRRRVTGWARPDQWEYANQLSRIVREQRPRTVLLSNDPEIAVFLRRAFPDLIVVHWFHNLEMASDRFRRAFASDNRIRPVAVSRYLARAVEQVYQMTPGRVRVALNGIDAEAYSSVDRARAVPVIGFVGRLAVEKGADVLLEACSILRREEVAFHVQIVGDTNWDGTNDNPFSVGVYRQIQRLQDAGVQVTRTGHLARDKIVSALGATDIHVVPSRWDEPCALTLFEGLASGQAVVGSATGGTPEVLAAAGRLFPREDPAALAGVLRPLLLDDALRREAGSAARRRAQELPWSRTWEILLDECSRPEGSQGTGKGAHDHSGH